MTLRMVPAVPARSNAPEPGSIGPRPRLPTKVRLAMVGLDRGSRVVVDVEVVGLDAVVAVDGALDGDEVLQPADPAVDPIEVVVLGAEGEDVLGVGGAAEHLEAVVLRVAHFHAVDHGSRSAALECDAVELVLLAEPDAGELDPDVIQGAAAPVAGCRRRSCRSCPHRRSRPGCRSSWRERRRSSPGRPSRPRSRVPTSNSEVKTIGFSRSPSAMICEPRRPISVP